MRKPVVPDARIRPRDSEVMIVRGWLSLSVCVVGGEGEGEGAV